MPRGISKTPEETKKKQSNSHKGKINLISLKNLDKNAFKGGHHTKEWGKKHSEFLLGHKVSKETRKKISEKQKGKPKWTDEQKIKIGLRSKGKLMGDNNPAKRPEVRKKISKAKKGKLHPNQRMENHPHWQGGKSFLPYSVNWTETLRQSIRERDHYVCQLCNKKQGDRVHSVHHIDYDKNNCNPNNLITLCNSCNAKVNFNREYWTNYFYSMFPEI